MNSKIQESPNLSLFASSLCFVFLFCFFFFFFFFSLDLGYNGRVTCRWGKMKIERTRCD